MVRATGTVTLSGANTFTGVTQVSEGVLRVSKADALRAASSVLVTGTGTFEIDNVVFNSLASLTLAGKAPAQETLAGRGAAFYDGAVTLRGAGRVGAKEASDALTLRGQINGEINQGTPPTLTKTGAGAVTLSVANSYTGGTTIEAGTLIAQHASALGAADVVVNDGASLRIANVGLITGICCAIY